MKLTEELEELKYRKKDLRLSLGKRNDKETKEVKAWIDSQETELKKAEDFDAKYSAHLDIALAKHHALEEQAAGVDPQALYDARHTIREEEERKLLSLSWKEVTEPALSLTFCGRPKKNICPAWRGCQNKARALCTPGSAAGAEEGEESRNVENKRSQALDR